jgi:hypothetical protein
MIGLPTCFANTFMRLFWENLLIGIPKIAKALTNSITFWNLLPKFSASSFAAVSNHEGYDLACAATHKGSNPTFIGFLTHE